MRLRLRSLALDPKLLAIGLGGGVLSGLLGVGGGIVMVPLLVLWAGYAQREAHAMSLGAIIPISMAGIATYGVAGEVRWWQALGLAVGSIVGARIGAGILARIDERLHTRRVQFSIADFLPRRRIDDSDGIGGAIEQLASVLIQGIRVDCVEQNLVFALLYVV